MQTSSTKPSLLHVLVSYLGVLYLYAVGKTSLVFKIDHPAYFILRRKRSPLIYAFWHNCQVFLVYAHRGQWISPLVSRSKDGEYISQVLKRFGFIAVRG